MFVAGALIMLVGVSPAFKNDKFEGVLHMVGAYGGVILSILSIAIEYNSFVYSFIVVVFMMFTLTEADFKPFRIKFIKNYIWYSEKIVIRAVWLFMVFNSVLLFWENFKNNL